MPSKSSRYGLVAILATGLVCAAQAAEPADHVDPMVGKGALDEREAAAFAEYAGNYRVPHFKAVPEGSADVWAEVASYDVPEWLIDGKLGVYTHWGPGNVTEFAPAGNYIRGMYDKRNPKDIYEFHQENFGGFTEVGYSDIIGMFTAKEYDPQGRPRLAEGVEFDGEKPSQMPLFTPGAEIVADLLRDVDLDRLTPLAALNLIASLQDRLK